MPFKPGRVQPDFSSLVTSLDNSQTQTSNYSLYQTILFLIKNTSRARDLLVDSIDTINDDISAIDAATFLTVNDETSTFPNSRQLLAGTGVSFDDTIDNKRTINVTAVSADHVPLATGAEPLEIMSDGAGHCFLVGFTPP
jgi:hypothetical protein